MEEICMKQQVLLDEFSKMMEWLITINKKHGLCTERKAGNFMKIDFLYMTNLQYEVKSLRAQVADFQSGETYHSMKAELMQQLRATERQLQAAKQEL